MFELIKNSPTGGDETSGYDVALNGEYTVGDLLSEVVSNVSEWGMFTVRKGGECEYRWGELIGVISHEVLSRKIRKVSARGGWSNMDYYVITE